MTYTVQFHNVSKKYRLGMTRTSLPSMLFDFSKSLLRRGQKAETGGTQFHWAVRDVNFDLQAGESLALVGPNGAGKTSILKLLAHITRPTSGEIKVNGKLSALIELGAGFHPDLSGRENIYLNGTILGIKRAEIRKLFDEIVAFSELEQFIDTPVKRYSSGMAVRLGFAVAASIKPEILLVDEVLAVGDTSFRMKCMQRIAQLIKGGTSLIFVSHNTGLIKAVCKKSLYIDRGQMIYYGDTDQAIDLYNQALNERRKKQLKPDELAEDLSAGHLDIASVKMALSDGTVAEHFNPSQPAQAMIHYTAYKDIAAVQIVLRIIRTDGISCAVLYSDLDDAHFSIARGNGVITANLEPLQLFPGVYYLVATALNADKSVTFSMGRSEWFEVKGDHIGYEDRDAVFEPRRQWAHHPTPQG